MGLLVGSPLASAQQIPIDLETVVSAWSATIEASRNLKPYELKGKTVSEAPAFPDANSMEYRWRIVRAGEKYRCEWQLPNGEQNVQTFNGKIWNGLTTDKGTSSGIICENPVKSLGTDLDEDLKKDAMGLFPLSLEDFLRKPFNVGGGDLSEIYAHLPRGLALSVSGNRYTVLKRNSDKSSSGALDSITIELGLSALPSSLKYTDPKNKNLSVKWAVLSQEDFQGLQVPTKIVSALKDTRKGGKLLQEVTTTLEWKEIKPASDLFQIRFPSKLNLFDDRKPVTVRYKSSAQPAKSNSLSVAILAGLASMLTLICWFWWKSRRAS